MRKDYLAKITASTTILIIGVATSIKTKNPGLLGLTSITSLLIYLSARKTSNIHGRTRNIKIINSTLPNIIEYTALITTSIHISNLFILLTATAVIGFSNTVKKEISNKINKKKTMYGRTERITTLSIVLIAATLNQYLLTYGIIIITGLTLIDLIYNTIKLTK